MKKVLMSIIVAFLSTAYGLELRKSPNDIAMTNGKDTLRQIIEKKQFDKFKKRLKDPFRLVTIVRADNRFFKAESIDEIQEPQMGISTGDLDGVVASREIHSGAGASKRDQKVIAEIWRVIQETGHAAMDFGATSLTMCPWLKFQGASGRNCSSLSWALSCEPGKPEISVVYLECHK